MGRRTSKLLRDSRRKSCAVSTGETCRRSSSTSFRKCTSSPPLSPRPAELMGLWNSCRSGASDLPQIAALMGGLVAQEAIKLVTKQYVPLNGTCILNGIRSTTSVVKG